MTITFPCTGCGKQYKATGQSAGKQIKCTDCGTIVRIPVPRKIATPAPSRTADEVVCPSCHATCGVLPEWRGKMLECPTCHQRFTVPALGGSAGASIPTARPVPVFHADDANDAASSPLHAYLDESESSDGTDDEYSPSRHFRRPTSSNLPAWVSSPRFWVTAGGVVVAAVVILAVLLGPVRRAVTDISQSVSKAALPLPPPDRYVSPSSVALIRVAELMDGRLDSFGSGKQEILDVPEQALSTGLDLRDIELMYLDRSTPTFMVAILKRPVDISQGSAGAEVCETHAQFTIFETRDGDYRFYPHPRMVVQTDDLEWLELKLDRPAPTTSSALEFPSDCQIAIRSDGGLSGSSFGPIAWKPQFFWGYAPEGAYYKRAIFPRGGLFGLTFASGRVDARIDVEFRDAVDATEYKSRYESGAAAIRQQLNQQTKKVNRDLAEQRMLNTLLASNVTANGQIASIRFSFSAAELASQPTALGTPQRPPGQRKSKTPGETFVTVRVTGVPVGADDALYKRIFSLAGEPKNYSATRLSDTVIARLNSNVTAEELAKRIDFGEVKRVKARGVLVAADAKRVASLPKPGGPQNTASSLSKELAPSGTSARAAAEPFDFVAKFKADVASTDSKRRRKAVSDLCTTAPNEHRDEIAKELEGLIADEDSDVAEASLQALRTWGGSSCVPNVILLLRTTRSSTIRAEAMLTLAKFPDEQGAQAVADHWDSKTAPIALEAMGPVAEKALASVLKNREPGAPEGACKILKRLQQKQPLAEETVLALITYIRDEQFPTRTRGAIELLSTVKEVYVAEAIADQLIKGIGLRDNIVKALINLGPVAEDVVLERCLKNDDPFVRPLACDVLKAIGTKKSIPALQKAARDFVTKKHAEEAIAEITKRSKQKS